MKPSIGVSSVFIKAIKPKSGYLSQKLIFFFNFLNKVVQALAAVRFQGSINNHKLNQKENQVWSQPTMEWLRYRQFN
jgi:hypothetical protein